MDVDVSHFVDDGLSVKKKILQWSGRLSVQSVWSSETRNTTTVSRWGKQKHQSDVLDAADKTGRHKSNGDADESKGWGILGQDKGPNGKET
jgi:hypothetical protein